MAVTWPGRDRYLIEVVAPASKCRVLECAIWPRRPHERLLEGWPPGGEHGVPGTNHSPPHFVWRAHILDTYAASGPEPATWKDPDPRRRSSRGSEGFRIGLPARRWRSRDACGLSRLNDSPWRYGLRRTCRPVTGRSYRPRSPWPIQNRLAHLAITHRYKRAHCLWLEQFQIAESARRIIALHAPQSPLRTSNSVLTFPQAGPRTGRVAADESAARRAAPVQDTAPRARNRTGGCHRP